MANSPNIAISPNFIYKYILYKNIFDKIRFFLSEYNNKKYRKIADIAQCTIANLAEPSINILEIIHVEDIFLWAILSPFTILKNTKCIQYKKKTCYCGI